MLTLGRSLFFFLGQPKILIFGESADQNVGVIERRGRESREILDQAK
jgi:hypothetical protein